MKYGDLTYEEIRQRADRAAWPSFPRDAPSSRALTSLWTSIPGSWSRCAMLLPKKLTWTTAFGP